MKIIVVEDEKPIREGLSKTIPKMGDSYEVIGSASNGKKGIMMIEKLHPDVIIMDIQMPDMDGLSMLSCLREKKIQVKAIVLTAYSDFQYAQKSIELGVSKYLLKPIKLGQLEQALSETKAQLEKENTGKKILSANHIFLSCLNGNAGKEMMDMLIHKYGIVPGQPIFICSIYFPSKENNQKKNSEELIRGLKKNTFFKFEAVWMRQSWFFILYQWSTENIEAYIEKNVLPMFCGNLKGELIFTWKRSDGAEKIQEAALRAEELREWNLVLERGTLITEEKVKQLTVHKLDYPMNLEHEIRKAVIHDNQKGLLTCLEQFFLQCRRKTYSPSSIREACIRCCWVLIHTLKEYKMMWKDEAFIQESLSRLLHAVSWEGIRCVLKDDFCCESVDKSFKTKTDLKSLGARAVRMIEDYYSQGITLGEIADSLCVSEEYLSGQIKKETGSSFSVLIKEKRIREVKKLLVTTKLRLNQIAALVGYTDPKYMSKVFKEVTGVLPSEYRKTH